MIDRNRFFSAVRKSPFPGKLTQPQVDGMLAILGEWELRALTDLRHLAYMLATVYLETRTMQPIHEKGGTSYFFRMYDKGGSRPSVAKALGNTLPGDGAKFHGRGYVQLTGRANYHKASQKLGIDFVANPDRVLEPRLAASIMFLGMAEGWFTGRKLSDYLNANKTDWKNARRIINGTDKADTIAGYAKSFYAALKAADDPLVKPAPPPPVKPEPSEPAKPFNFFAWLWKWLIG